MKTAPIETARTPAANADKRHDKGARGPGGPGHASSPQPLGESRSETVASRRPVRRRKKTEHYIDRNYAKLMLTKEGKISSEDLAALAREAEESGLEIDLCDTESNVGDSDDEISEDGGGDAGPEGVGHPSATASVTEAGGAARGEDPQVVRSGRGAHPVGRKRSRVEPKPPATRKRRKKSDPVGGRAVCPSSPHMDRVHGDPHLLGGCPGRCARSGDSAGSEPTPWRRKRARASWTPIRRVRGRHRQTLG